MRVEQMRWGEKEWNYISESQLGTDADLVFVFGDKEKLREVKKFAKLRKRYPKADIVMGSTSGEILGGILYEGSATASALSFDHSYVLSMQLRVNNQD